MQRTVRGFGLLFSALALAAIPVSAQDGVAGTWTVSISSPEVGTMESEFVFEQDGAEVSGTAELQMPVDGVELSDGVYEDGVLSFLMHVGLEGQWFTVEVEADVDGDEMSGEVYVPDMGMAMPFTAKRKGG
ncbi:MAG TPA: hypothetical protein DIT46_09965 [Gemmatimonadetes bacterium]|nr:hypothetical protein [Gemmatimonadota bacterium]|tara:strand:- start:11283 stop:11675 length:393 start_codon:yes stop_codon:yes gene_type:complete